MKLAIGIHTFAALLFGVAAVHAQRLPAEVDSSSLATSSQVDASVAVTSPLSEVSADESALRQSPAEPPTSAASANRRSVPGKYNRTDDAAFTGMAASPKTMSAVSVAPFRQSPNLTNDVAGSSSGRLAGSAQAASKTHTVDGRLAAGIAEGRKPAAALGAPPVVVGQSAQSPQASWRDSWPPDSTSPQGRGGQPAVGSEVVSGLPSVRRPALSSFATQTANRSNARISYDEQQKSTGAERVNKVTGASSGSLHKNLHESLQSSRPKSLKQRRADERHAACPSCRD
jgi:hypothetical protein